MRDDLSLLAVALRLSPVLVGLAAWSAIAGLAVASRLGCHRDRTALVSVLLPVLGPVAVLVGVTVARRRRRAVRGRPPALSVHPPTAVGAPPPMTVQATAADASWFEDGPAVAVLSAGRASALPAPGGRVESWFETPAPPSPVVDDGPAPQPETGAPAPARLPGLPLALCVLAVVPAALLFFALFSSWGAVRGAFDVTTPAVGASPLTALPDALCAATFLLAGVLLAWRSAGRWTVLAGAAGLAALTAGVVAHTLFAVSDVLVDRVRRLPEVRRFPVDATVEAGDAVPLLVVGGASGLLWALACMLVVDRARLAAARTRATEL